MSTLTIIIVLLIMLVIWFYIWYAYAKWELDPKIANLKNQLDVAIDRYNKDVNDVKSLNENLRSVNSKLKWDIATLKSDIIELKVKAKDVVSKKLNKTDDTLHKDIKKKWRPAKK